MVGVHHLQWGIHIVPFLSPLKHNYEGLFKKQREKDSNWKKYSHDGTKLGVYEEV